MEKQTFEGYIASISSQNRHLTPTFDEFLGFPSDSQFHPLSESDTIDPDNVLKFWGEENIPLG